MNDLHAIVDKLVRKYWVGYPQYVTDCYVARHVFEIGLLKHALGQVNGRTVVDVGGGWGAFASSCAALGMKAILVDDFGDSGKSNKQDPRQSLPRDYGINVVRRDVIKDGLGLAPGSVDAIVSFDMIEHLHASPKRFLHDAITSLRKDGVLLLGAPNCVNMRKRITVPLGRGKWSDFSAWYDTNEFRGHVREPDVQDLRRIAQDIALYDYRVLGRNWLGHKNQNQLIRIACRATDRMLRFFPSLCSDLYLLGWKR